MHNTGGQLTIGSRTISSENPIGIPGTGGVNTVLVDGVDSSEGPHIVKTVGLHHNVRIAVELLNLAENPREVFNHLFR